MDVFYYWKDFVADTKAGNVGRFRSKKDQLDELHAGYPSYVWAFKTPKGRKGELQLLARLVWSDKPPLGFKPATDESHIFYDPTHRDSVWFEGTETDESLARITSWASRNFPGIFATNLQGVNGQREMRNPVLSELNSIARLLKTRPFQASAATEA